MPIEKFIAWYCSEPRLGFSRSVVVRYCSFPEGLSLSGATTERYIGCRQNFREAVYDRFRISL
jgi:hypothetical protein